MVDDCGEPNETTEYVKDRLKINVGGVIYETRERTLARYPDSLLGDPEKRQEYYCPKLNEYFFNRHRRAFESILYYYQSGGRLILPKDIPTRLFFEEVEFFDLGDEALRLVSKGLFAGKNKPTTGIAPSRSFQRKVWETFEFPELSSYARLLSIFCITMIVLSIILSCLATSAVFQEQYCVERCPNTFANHSNVSSNKSCCKFSHKPVQAVVVLDFFCYGWFLVEYSCRLASSPSKKHFFLSFLNCIDFIVFVPFFITYFITLADKMSPETSLRLTSLTKLLRIARIAKLARYSRALQVLGSTLRASVNELKLMMMFMSLVVILSSCTLYLIEFEEPNTYIHSIVDGFWWSVTTITTVGYGDVYPVSAFGKFIGSLCTVLGALTFSFPVIVFATNFRACYKSGDSVTAEYHRNLKTGAYESTAKPC